MTKKMGMTQIGIPAEPPRHLRLLLVEDNPGDAALIEHQFVRSGYTIAAKRIDSPLELAGALLDKGWDGIICDYHMPQFDAFDALRLYRESGCEMPILVVSGVLGEQHAVEAIRAGAHDYLHKNRLVHLPGALERAIREVSIGRAQKAAEERARRANFRLATILERMVEGYVVFDNSWAIVGVNRKAQDLFRRDREQLLGRSIWEQCTELAGSVMQTEFEHAMRDNKSVDIEMRLPESTYWVRIHAYPSADGLTAFLQDVTSQKSAEDDLRQSLAVKGALLREIHHRVKNNLQMVCSLMRLQVNSVEDNRLQHLFQRSERRILCLAAIHDRLCQSDDPGEIDLAEHVAVVAKQVFDSMANTGIRLSLDVMPVAVTMDIAIPCGLILNELVANALLHAFPEGAEGTVSVSLITSEQEIVLSVTDDGIGMSADPRPRSRSSLGFRLVGTLARQLSGIAEFTTSGGTRWDVRFPRMSPDAYVAAEPEPMEAIR